MGFVHHESRELASDFYHVANMRKRDTLFGVYDMYFVIQV